MTISLSLRCGNITGAVPWRHDVNVKIYLTFSALSTKTETLANSVDPDEMARNEPFHQDLRCFPF